MDEESKEEKPSASIFLSRFRSPTFSRNEVQTLINIIEKHKYTILNKSTNSTVNQAKEVSWEKITKIFNSKGFKHERSIDSLKTKWENLKKDARKLSKNVIDVDNGGYNDLTRQIVGMMCDVENNPPAELAQDLDDNDFNDPSLSYEKLSESLKRKSYWESCEEKNSDDSNGGDDDRRSNRSLNFAPQECSLLLECVRKEKNFVFSKEYNTHAIGLKNKAWRRITDVFNRKSPQKRTQKMLRTKFNNMKTIAKTIGAKDSIKNFDICVNKHEKLINENSKKIKSEPVFDLELENDDDDDDDDDGRHSDGNHNNFAPDPLGTILNSDSGIGSTHSSSWSQENKEVVKLKKELLNYQMETARLERQKVEEAKQAESAATEAKAIETSLRLRAARLEAVAAAMKLPPGHPALLFTPGEMPAERYLRQYEHT